MRLAILDTDLAMFRYTWIEQIVQAAARLTRPTCVDHGFPSLLPSGLVQTLDEGGASRALSRLSWATPFPHSEFREKQHTSASQHVEVLDEYARQGFKFAKRCDLLVPNVGDILGRRFTMTKLRGWMLSDDSRRIDEDCEWLICDYIFVMDPATVQLPGPHGDIQIAAQILALFVLKGKGNAIFTVISRYVPLSDADAEQDPYPQFGVLAGCLYYDEVEAPMVTRASHLLAPFAKTPFKLDCIVKPVVHVLPLYKDHILILIFYMILKLTSLNSAVLSPGVKSSEKVHRTKHGTTPFALGNMQLNKRVVRDHC
ncbi:hypothetical protein EDD15DRAFT_2367035 [Pisolithus albus]|nr:hypothetical protein EDD15DRAFT_2367035 [Pisolithus albus]